MYRAESVRRYTLLPMLFLLVIDDVLRAALVGGCGESNLRMSSFLKHLEYDDYICFPNGYAFGKKTGKIGSTKLMSVARLIVQDLSLLFCLKSINAFALAPPSRLEYSAPMFPLSWYMKVAWGYFPANFY